MDLTFFCVKLHLSGLPPSDKTPKVLLEEDAVIPGGDFLVHETVICEELCLKFSYVALRCRLRIAVDQKRFPRELRG